jgi:hypothetical protein
MIIRLADFLAPFRGSIKHDEISRLSKAAAEDVADLYTEQLSINERIVNELRAVNAENAGLTSLVNSLTSSINAMSIEYTAAAAAGVAHYKLIHDPAVHSITTTNTDRSPLYGQVVLVENSGTINRIPYYTDDRGIRRASTSVVVSVVDGNDSPVTLAGDPKNAMVDDPKQYWLEPNPISTSKYKVTVEVPTVRGIGANMVSFCPIPAAGTICENIEYRSTSGLWVSIGAPSTYGAQRVYFYAPDFGDAVRLSFDTGSGEHLVGLYNLSIKQVAYNSTGSFYFRLPSTGAHDARIATSFEVDYDLVGLDRTYRPEEFVDFKLYAGNASAPLSPLDVPVGLTQDMPSIELSSGDPVSYLWLKATFNNYNGVTPVYRGCLVTYLK